MVTTVIQGGEITPFSPVHSGAARSVPGSNPPKAWIPDLVGDFLRSHPENLALSSQPKNRNSGSPYPDLDDDGKPIMDYTMPYPLYPLGITSVPPNNSHSHSHSHSSTISAPSGGVVDPASSGPEIDPRLIPPPRSAKSSYPFPCDKCSFGYSNADALRRHRSEYHGELTDIGRKRKENQRKAKEAPQESQFTCDVGECVFAAALQMQSLFFRRLPSDTGNKACKQYTLALFVRLVWTDTLCGRVLLVADSDFNNGPGMMMVSRGETNSFNLIYVEYVFPKPNKPAKKNPFKLV
ncbi:hypothetical protein PGQ11_006133 [Apiospora arundinis]|uniref:C2H2-type domain-containing protein n=1 Tax=Apiospora arundinis TaxID=335852 RepID=A0ABR2ISE5_9PEZI